LRVGVFSPFTVGTEFDKLIEKPHAQGGVVQRLLSLGTLGVMGWLGWIFLSGGGLAGISTAPRTGSSGYPQPGYPSTGSYQSPGPWDARAGQPTVTSQTGSYQTASAGGNAPPQNVGMGPTITIASFNIKDFGPTKAGKGYVMRELAEIINRFDVVAVQEISTTDEYMVRKFLRLVNQLGSQIGRNYDYVIGPRLGVTTQKEQYAYIFETGKIEIDRHSVFTVSDPEGMLDREPLVATFRTRGVDPDQAFTFTLVNVHVDPDLVEREMEALALVYKVVRRESRGEDDIILLGDFNTDDRRLGRLGQLPGMLPLIAGVSTNTRQTAQYDNVILHKPSTTEYSGNSGVYDFMRYKNLSLEQALQVSDHFPVWAEFSIYERDGFGRVASRRRMYGR